MGRKKGSTPWNKGKKTGPMNKNQRKLISEGLLSAYKNGRSGFIKGSTPWNKGVKYDEKIKSKLNIDGLKLGRLEKYHTCKSNSYGAIHYWVRKNKGLAKICSICGSLGGKKGCTWANIDHKYKRVLSDYFEACNKCHFDYDTRQGLRSEHINPKSRGVIT